MPFTNYSTKLTNQRKGKQCVGIFAGAGKAEATLADFFLALRAPMCRMTHTIRLEVRAGNNQYTSANRHVGVAEGEEGRVE